jgi:hypothetical protein
MRANQYSERKMTVKAIVSRLAARLIWAASFLLAVLAAPALAQEASASSETQATPGLAVTAEASEEDALQAEARRRAAAEVEAKRASEELAARQRMRAYQAQERARQREVRERQCVIKPVMSDEEIDLCRRVWR